MNRRTFLGAAAATAMPLTPSRLHADAILPPNLVFVFSDQQRWDTADCYGQPLFPGLTPNLDRLANDGVRFEHAFTCQPVCGPARSCLQTGKWATETGCFTNDRALPLEETTIAHRLADAGYEVGYVGKWHLASTTREGIDHRMTAVPVERRGGYRDYWVAADVPEFTSHSYDGRLFGADMQPAPFPPGRYRADFFTDCALDFLRSRTGARPFFLFVSYIEPHHQNDHSHFEGPHGSKEQFRDHRVPADLAALKGDWGQELPDYLGCCHAVDAGLGRIRDELGRLGLADNTLVVYTSDHGCHFRTRNGDYKRSCHDSSIRVPLIAAGPGFGGAQVVEDLVSLIDLPPTLLSAAGVGVPNAMRGRPLQPLAAGTATDWPDAVFVQISESQVGRALRTRRWKYSVRVPKGAGWQGTDSDTYTESFLYNLESDPAELRNLVQDPQHAGVRAELRERLLRQLAAAGEPPTGIVPANS